MSQQTTCKQCSRSFPYVPNRPYCPSCVADMQQTLSNAMQYALNKKYCPKCSTVTISVPMIEITDSWECPNCLYRVYKPGHVTVPPPTPKCKQCGSDGGMFGLWHGHCTICNLNYWSTPSSAGQNYTYSRPNPFTTTNQQGAPSVTPQQSCRIWWDVSIQAYRLSSSYNKDLVDALKAFIPVSDRSFDTGTKIWTITEKYFQPLLSLISKLHINPTVITRQQAEAAKTGSTTGSGYGSSSNAVTRTTLSVIDKACLDFMKLLPYDAAQAAYRKAAMLLHPDRGGDMEKMTQLNQLWTVIEKELYKPV